MAVASSAHVVQYNGDPKPVGTFGAPALRCTPLLIALSVALLGLIFVGIGGCMAGFLRHEALTKWSGVTLVAFGLLMIIGGLGFWIYDCVAGSSSANRRARAPLRPVASPTRPVNAASAGYTPAPQAVSQPRPGYTTAPQAVSQPHPGYTPAPQAVSQPHPPPTQHREQTQLSVVSPPHQAVARVPLQQQAAAPRQPQPQRQLREEPPPAYDSLGNQQGDVRIRPAQNTNRTQRTSYATAVRDQRILSTTAV